MSNPNINLADHRAPTSADVHLEIEINAPADVVFDFLVVPELAMRWMGLDREIDPRPGGTHRVRYAENDVAVGEYVDVDRATRVSWTWGWDGSAQIPPGSSLVQIDLEEAGGVTTVRLTHTGLPDIPAAESHTHGWSYWGRRLATAVSGGDPDLVEWGDDPERADFDQALADVRAAELELMKQRERVAASRRAIPLAPAGPDYQFSELADGTEQAVSLSDLFSAPDRTLVVYHFMFGKRQEHACPMCSGFADGWNAIAHHLAERVDFVVAASSPIDEWVELAASKGWNDLRLISAAPSSFKADIGGEDADGNQSPFISVWTLDDAGRPRQRYGGSAGFDAEHWRGLDLLSPIWHFLDLTPEGRGDFMPS